METILLVDDDLATLEIINACLRPYFRTRIATRGEKAIELAHLEPAPDLVLLDVELPDMDGYEICAALKNDPQTAGIPVIFLSSHSDIAETTRGLDLGAVDYVAKPVAPPILLARMRTHLRLHEAQRHLEGRNLDLESSIRKRAETLEATAEQLRLNRQLTLTVLGELATMRDPGGSAHLVRTREYMQRLVAVLRRRPGQLERLSPEQWTLTWQCAPLHDIGNIAIPDRLLFKPGRLDANELACVKNHTVHGQRVLAAAEPCVGNDDPFLQVASAIVYAHHEHWDGNGYPQGLCGEAIPLPARLMAVADVYDALISERLYRVAVPHGEAVNIIRQSSGKQFDPLLVDCFLGCAEAWYEIAQRHPADVLAQ
ncbi:MAG: response regulator [Candidatus Accumulibacter sp.]|nr:response regulator [Accumulibacter sp.]